jgi:hypothetical protein
MADGLGFQPRIGEPELNLVSGMAAPKPLGSPQSLLSPAQLASITDTSLPLSVALQQVLPWTYDTDPATGLARATFPGEIGPPPVTMGRNKLINGDGRYDVRNNHAGIAIGAATSYLADRWQVQSTQAGKFNAQTINFGLPPSGFPYIFQFTVTSAYTPLGTDIFSFQTKIEGYDIIDFNFGSGAASYVMPLTLSWYAASTAGGTFSGVISNSSSNRSYPFTFTVPAGNIAAIGSWNRYSVTFPSDYIGSWATDNTLGLQVGFDLGCGAGQRGPASNAWQTGTFFGATGATQLVSIASAQFALGGIQLEAGNVASPFERVAAAALINACGRYYRRFTGGAGSITLQGYGAAGQNVSFPLVLPPMRANPVGAIIGTWTTTNAPQPVLGINHPGLIVLNVAPTALGAFQIINPTNGGFDLNAEL